MSAESHARQQPAARPAAMRAERRRRLLHSDGYPPGYLAQLARPRRVGGLNWRALVERALAPPAQPPRPAQSTSRSRPSSTW